MTHRSLALRLGLAYLGLGALGSMPGALAGLFRTDERRKAPPAA